LLATDTKAQEFFTGTEYGVLMGGSQYFGDLNNNYGFKTIHPALGIFVRYQINPYISVKGVVNYTHVGYSDALNNDPFEKARNLSFESDIAEGALQAEFNFFRFATGEDGSRFTPYLTGGIGVFYYNPYTYYQGNKYFLRPLGTEGQNVQGGGFGGRRYSTLALCFPIGMGVKYWLRPGLNIGFEIADRLTNTDYLDDVSNTYVGANNFTTGTAAYALQDRSRELNPDNTLGRVGKQRGDNSTFDQYLMFQVVVSFQLKTYKCPNFLKKEEFANRY
jgi:hypothetical protein